MFLARKDPVSVGERDGNREGSNDARLSSFGVVVVVEKKDPASLGASEGEKLGSDVGKSGI